ncbi:MAG: hypothetical protein EA378_11410 [Phycisphaerales bacterium]|nr:MAG: hypothetical protein EA378_11410 [Phycisphaerales bacterium]
MIAEPKPGEAGDAVIEEVFLAPRVLDRRAFEQYAEELKGLIRSASAEQHALAGAAGGIGELRESLREGTGLLQKKIEAAAKLLPGLDERLRAAEALLSKATDQASLAETIERRIEAAVTARVEGLEQRLSATVERLEARALAAEAKLEAATARLEQLGEEAATTAARSAEAATGPVIARAEAAAATLEQKVASTERKAGDLQDRFESQGDAALASLEATGQAVASRLADLHAEAEMAGAALEARAERVSAMANGAELEAVRGLLERAERLVGRPLDDDSGEEPAPGSLLAILSELESAGAMSDRRASELASLAEQGERVRALLVDAVTGSAESVDAIERRQEALMRRVREVEDRCRVLDNGTEVIDEKLAEAMEPRMETLRVRVAEASSWLSGLIDRAHEAAQLLAIAVDEQRDSEASRRDDGGASSSAA